MTAEVAILNKSAVALAADSAVTISIGEREEKTYDTADKLFELCRHNPIGIMVYNGLSFAEIPLQTIIKQYRMECSRFDTVKEASFNFLDHLNSLGKNSPQRVKDDSVRDVIRPVMEAISNRSSDAIRKLFSEATDDEASDFRKRIAEIIQEAIGFYENIYKKQKAAQFVGGNPDPNSVIGVVRDAVNADFAGRMFTDADRARIVEVAKLALTANVLTGGCAGIVIAGFGTKELFPTLISFEIDGMVGDHLKYIEVNHVDIDRAGPRARVIPFAQKEMMDQFMYGMDDGIESNITKFCEETVPAIRKAIMDRIEFEGEADKADFEKGVSEAERSFVTGLGTTAFAEIRKGSEVALEGMVEFMPKPELAKMAEALVNLTSIKRRVSRGMETVGGPIDVAVISQAEGFVWVKRKHYFPPELNPRYLERVREQAHLNQENHHAQVAQPRGPRKARRAKATKVAVGGQAIQGPPEGREGYPGGDQPVAQDGQNSQN